MKRDLTRGWTRGRATVHVTASATAAGRTARTSWRMALVAACALLGMLLLAASASAFTNTGNVIGGGATPNGGMTPNRIDVDAASGDIYVLDEANGVVNRFDHNGRYLSQLTGSFGFGGFDDVAVDNSGTATQGYVYVEGENGVGPGSISAFDAHGNLRWTSDSAFPSGQLLCGAAVDPTTGNLWTADADNGVHQRSVADGSAIGSAIATGSTPCRIAFDASGDLYVTHYQGAIDKYPPPPTDPPASTPDTGSNIDLGTDSQTGDLYADHGSSVSVYDSTGTALPSSPFGGANAGIGVDGSHRLVYLSDTSANDVQIWTMDTGTSKAFASASDATSVTGTSATLNGTVDPAGSAVTTCQFDYGTTTAYGLTAPCATNPGSGTSDAPVTAALTGLTPGATYHYRIDVTNGGGTVTGDDNTVTASVPPTLNVTVGGSGSGTVTDDTNAINCTNVGGSGCSASFPSSTVIHLTATSSAGSRFAGWDVSGASSTTCSGTTSPCDVTMGSNDVTVRATFTRQDRLSVQTSGSGGGTVTDSTNAIACGATCSALFDDGTTVTLSAAPDGNSTFVGWSSGGCSGTGQCQVTLSADTAVAATFAQKVPDVVTGAASGVTQTGATVAGSVNPHGDGSTTCHFDYGTSTSYGSTAPCAPAPGSGSSAVSVSASLSGLTAGTTYHYRLVATNSGGPTAGADATFTTTAASTPPPPGPGTLKLASHKATMKPASAPKTASVKVSCTGATGAKCTGKATFKATIKVKVKKGKKTVIKKKTITVGTVSFNLSAGGSGTLSIKLTSAAKSALKRGALSAKASNVTGGSVSLPKTKVKKKKKK